MKFFLETFFFGYLTLKWKLLARVLSLLLYCVLFLLVIEGEFQSYEIEGINGSLNYVNAIAMFGTPFFIFLLSWVIKPFILNEED